MADRVATQRFVVAVMSGCHHVLIIDCSCIAESSQQVMLYYFTSIFPFRVG